MAATANGSNAVNKSTFSFSCFVILTFVSQSFYPVANVNYPSGVAPTAVAGAAYPGNNAAYPSAVG